MKTHLFERLNFLRESDFVKIANVACIGTGLIGIGWATFFSLKGLNVAVQDHDRKRLDRVIGDVELTLRCLKEKNIINDEGIRSALDKIAVHNEICEAVAVADYVQESVFESCDLKKRVFAEIESNCPRGAVVASSTSALSMTEIQKAVRLPERCIIVHPMNPVYIIPLVEIVPGSNTSKTTIDLTYEFMTALGKTAVVCKKEVPGFIINRLQSALYREAFDLVDKGVATVEEVDEAVTAGLGLRWAFMGPFLIMHLAGGQGGIEYWLKHLAESYKIRWESMATWSSIPESARRKVVEGIRDHRLIKGRRYDDVVKWRDEKLTELLSVA